VAEVRRAAIQFKYEVFNTDSGKVCTEGYTWHVMMGASRKATSIPPAIREMLARDPAEWETVE
jgi:acyl-CoA thioesterase FadM